MFSRSERDRYIKDKIQEAPRHLRGTIVNRLQEETELSRARIYQIANINSKSKY